MTNKNITLVALISHRGIESIQRGYINSDSPILNSNIKDLGNCLLELTTDRKTARELESQVEFVRSMLGGNWALRFVYDIYIELRRVKITYVAPSDSTFLQDDSQVVFSSTYNFNISI